MDIELQEKMAQRLAEYLENCSKLDLFMLYKHVFGCGDQLVTKANEQMGG